MTLTRRQLLHVAGAGLLAAMPSPGFAQTYPARPVRVVVPFAAGGPSDLVARPVAQWLSERFGQSFVVENRSGAGGNIGAESVVRSPADGYTLLMVSTPNTINATMHDKISFDLVRDITGVAGIGRVPNVIVVHPSVPAATLPEFIAYAKANPGKLSGALGGIGTSGHVASELFKLATGADFVLVPYRGGGPALTDLLAGQVQVYFGPAPLTLDAIRTGRLRALAVTSAARSTLLPDIPAVAEFVPGYEATTFFGVGAPRNTPPDIVDALNRQIVAALADAKMAARLSAMGSEVLAGSPADFSKLMADETAKWGRIVKLAGIKAE